MRMFRVSVWMGALAVFGLLTIATGARAQEAEIPVDQVPKPIIDSAKAKYPGAQIRSAAKETEDGKTVYELSITHDNHKMDVTFMADGTMVLTETEVAESELPAPVLQAVKAKYAGAKIDLVESVKKGPQVKKEVDYYEFHLTTADKKSVEVEVDSQGKILKAE
jgi:uncharacterized membrane protein YkoI